MMDVVRLALEPARKKKSVKSPLKKSNPVTLMKKKKLVRIDKTIKKKEMTA